MRHPLRLSLFAAALLAVPALAAAATPKKLVCQLEQGLVVEASFGTKNELSKDLRVFRKGPGLAQVTRIAKEDVTSIQVGDKLTFGVDKDVDGITKRVLFVSFSPDDDAASIEVSPGAFMPKPQSGAATFAKHVTQAHAPCKISK